MAYSGGCCASSFTVSSSPGLSAASSSSGSLVATGSGSKRMLQQPRLPMMILGWSMSPPASRYLVRLSRTMPPVSPRRAAVLRFRRSSASPRGSCLPRRWPSSSASRTSRPVEGAFRTGIGGGGHHPRSLERSRTLPGAGRRAPAGDRRVELAELSRGCLALLAGDRVRQGEPCQPRSRARRRSPSKPSSPG